MRGKSTLCLSIVWVLGCDEGKVDKLVVGILQHTVPESCVGFRM